VEACCTRALFDDQRHDLVDQRALTHAPPARHPPKQRSAGDAASLEPALQRAHWAALEPLAVRNGSQLAGRLLVGLRAAQREHHAVARETQIGHLQDDQLRAAEGAAEADQQQRRIAQAAARQRDFIAHPQDASIRETLRPIRKVSQSTGARCSPPRSGAHWRWFRAWSTIRIGRRRGVRLRWRT
jgi:hypothetical protein